MKIKVLIDMRIMDKTMPWAMTVSTTTKTGKKVCKEFSNIATKKEEVFEPLEVLEALFKRGGLEIELVTNRKVIFNNAKEKLKQHKVNVSFEDRELIEDNIFNSSEKIPLELSDRLAEIRQKTELIDVAVSACFLKQLIYFKKHNLDIFETPLFQDMVKTGKFSEEMVMEDVFSVIEEFIGL